MQDENTRPERSALKVLCDPLTQGKISIHRRGRLSLGRNGAEDVAEKLDGASSESPAESRASNCEPWWLKAPPTVLASGLGSMGSMIGSGLGIGVS